MSTTIVHAVATLGIGSRQAVVFHRGGVRYATELTRLHEIRVCREITWIESVPPFSIGKISLRGEILPIFDLTRVFTPNAKRPQRPERILVVESSGRRAGLAADQVDDAITLSDFYTQEPLAFSGPRADLILGITHGDVLVLDSARLIQLAALVVAHSLD